MKDVELGAAPAERLTFTLTQLLGKRDTRVVVLIVIGILIGRLIDPSIRF